MERLKFNYATGGRELYFKAANVRDCCTRAIANATGMDYLEVYNGINELAKKEHKSKRHDKSSARNGVRASTIKKYIENVLGWVWIPCMGIGTGCQVHLCKDELPKDCSIIVNLSGHLSCVKNSELYDTYDCSRGGYRCVYGYWRRPTKEEKEMHDDAISIQAEYQEFCERQKRELKIKKEEVRKHNQQIMKKYSPKISKLSKMLKKLERERDKQLLPMPKLEKDAWAKFNIKSE